MENSLGPIHVKSGREVNLDIEIGAFIEIWRRDAAKHLLLLPGVRANKFTNLVFKLHTSTLSNPGFQDIQQAEA